jgi:hypothetical protein
MSEYEAEQLASLRHSWDTFYLIRYVEDGGYFYAGRIIEHDHRLTAASVAELKELIRTDYLAWQDAHKLYRPVIFSA